MTVTPMNDTMTQVATSGFSRNLIGETSFRKVVTFMNILGYVKNSKGNFSCAIELNSIGLAGAV